MWSHAPTPTPGPRGRTAQKAPHTGRKPKTMLAVLAPEPGRKSSRLALLVHRGGGWWDARCMGEARACAAGECRHIANLRVKNRSVHPVAREEA
jgi:hypothetical protein